MAARILHVAVTGAYGNVGTEVLRQLTRQGHRVTALDVQSPGNRKRAPGLLDEGVRTHWLDITQAAEVRHALQHLRPDAIVHLAARIPPAAYLDVALTERVNVDGTRNLVRAAEALQTRPRFVFASSYTVHGTRNGSRPLPPLSADSPYAAVEAYGAHKVRCEKLLRDSQLPWVILRLGACIPFKATEVPSPTELRMVFTLPRRSREHAIDPRDAGLAFANAATVQDAEGRILMIGGGEDWQVRQGELMARLQQATGLGPLSEKVYVSLDETVDEAWFCEDWMDTREAEALLQFQKHSVDDFVAEVRRQAGLGYYGLRVVGPLVRRAIERHSDYGRSAGGMERRSYAARLSDIFGEGVAVPIER